MAVTPTPGIFSTFAVTVDSADAETNNLPIVTLPGAGGVGHRNKGISAYIELWHLGLDAADSPTTNPIYVGTAADEQNTSWRVLSTHTVDDPLVLADVPTPWLLRLHAAAGQSVKLRCRVVISVND